MPITQKMNVGATYKALPYVDLQLHTNRKERKNAFLTPVMKRLTGEYEFTMDILPGNICKSNVQFTFLEACMKYTFSNVCT